MRSREQLDAMWADLQPLPREQGLVRLIVMRPAPGVHEVLETGELDPDKGLVGDRWIEDDKDLNYQITLMNVHAARIIRINDEQPMHTPGDNFLVDIDLSEESLPIGSRLRLGEALVEVTPEPHLGCKKFRERFGPGALSWVNDKAQRNLRLRGVNCRVIEAGMVSVGDQVRVERRGDG